MKPFFETFGAIVAFTLLLGLLALMLPGLAACQDILASGGAA